MFGFNAMRVIVCVVLVLAVVSGSSSLPPCSTVLTINATSPHCTESAKNTYTCQDLQTALDLLSNFNTDQQDCVIVLIHSGTNHYVTEPVFLDISVQFIGVSSNDLTEDLSERAGVNGTSLPLPSVVCNYTVDVDFDRIFDPNYNYTDYLFYFNSSASVSFRNIEMSSCPYPMRINGVDQVEVDNCRFKFFQEAVFDLYNCHNISITSSTFHDNVGTGISRYSFRGNTGAVAIGYNGLLPQYTNPRTFISYCNFTRNSATAATLFRSSSGAFFNQVFSGRGGAVGVFFNEDYHNISMEISDNLIQKNFARSFGGALFFVIYNEGTSHVIDIVRNQLLSNTGVLGGGAVQMTFVSNGIREQPHTTRFIDCLFYDNSGASGGAVYVYPLSFQGGEGNLAVIERCRFLSNRGLEGEGIQFGAALAVSYSASTVFRNRESLPKHRIVDCLFEGNSGTNGVVSIAYAPLLFSGSNVFQRNTGTSSLRIVGSLVEFYDQLSFVDNDVADVAALHMLSLGQFRVNSNLTLTFTGNLGRYGASILVETPVEVLAFNRLLFNPQCFIINHTPNIPPSLWDDVKVRFRGNRAVLGSSLYLSHVDNCGWSSVYHPFFNNTFIKEWPIWDFGYDSINSGFDNLYSIEHHVATSAVTIDTVNNSVTNWPGRLFTLHLTGWDQFDNPTFVSARFFAGGQAKQEKNMVNINPAIVITDSNKDSEGRLTNQYSLFYSVADTEPLYNPHTQLANVRVDIPFAELRGVKTDNFVIYPALCPVGYSFRFESVHRGIDCHCREDVPQILTCEDDQDTLLLQPGYWGAPYYGPNQYSDTLNHFYQCPAGYCRCSQETSLGSSVCVNTFTNSQPDKQCACSRQGVLCGECKFGYGVTAFNQCADCHDAYSILIIMLIVLDVLVFLFIALWDKPLPEWSYPLIFYLQIAPSVGQNFPNSFEIVGQYLSFVASALGFYFPYNFCLYNRMSPLASYFIRYIPLFIAAILSPLLIIIRRKRVRVLEHHGVWWILLMLYTPILHNSVSLLHCLYIEPLGQYRWFVDGSVQCFAGWHVPLTLLALSLLLLCFALIPITFFISIKMYPKRKLYWLRTVTGSLKHPFKKEFPWWYSIELGRRLVFIVLTLYIPSTYAVPLLILCVLVALYGMAKPYKSLLTNILEVVVLINFLLLLMVLSTDQITDRLYLFPPLTPSNTTACVDGYSGISNIAWLLVVPYYLPLALLLIIGVAFTIDYIRKNLTNRKKKSADMNVLGNTDSYVAPNTRSVSVRINWLNHAQEGEASTRTRAFRQRSNNIKERMSPVPETTTSIVFVDKNDVEITDS